MMRVSDSYRLTSEVISGIARAMTVAPTDASLGGTWRGRAVDRRGRPPCARRSDRLAVTYAPTEMRDSWYWTPGRAWHLLWPWALAAGLAVAATWRLRRHHARI
jgi:hypothetical protein